jgi:hypothetical protein
MSRNLIINEALARLAREETAFLHAEFLAPVVRGRGVAVRIAGVLCTLHVIPPAFHGWGVFQPVSHAVATLVREASAGERRQYLALFPGLRLVVCGRDGNRPLAVPAGAADARFEIAGPVEIQLAAEFDLFDTLLVRFDGARFWFDELESRSDPAAAAYLRKSLADMLDPDKLARHGLTEGQRRAYTAAFGQRTAPIRADEREDAGLRLKAALSHAGAGLHDFTESGQAYRVSFMLDGRRHTSVVRKHDLSVVTAGVCLSGQDRKFDLSSLVGVLREGATRGRFGFH